MILFKILIPFFSLAFMPKPTTILQKLAENNGSGAYIIEQEVQFPAQSEMIALKETWTIEADGRMKLLVTGLKELKGQIRLEYVYEGGSRITIKTGSGKQERRATDENFIEKYFHIRKGEQYAALLTQMKVLPASVLQRKPYKLGAEPDVIDDPHVRMARVGGTTAYAFGLPAEAGVDMAEVSPNFFIEQDSFVLRKFRLRSQAEVSADQYAVYSRGFNFPKTRTVKWQSSQGASQVVMHTLRVLPKNEKTSVFTLESSREIPSDLGSARTLIEEFYSRFR